VARCTPVCTHHAALLVTIAMSAAEVMPGLRKMNGDQTGSREGNMKLYIYDISQQFI
jgi:hypothetical protein